ncbi:MAG: NYN domain-containing protein [Trueperaceae bacterium]|nr:NYN domain-containing protein [Trueperaceae bacterium]MCO5173888.1 NYN domain-containing protein [Trueperaceae bacterium]MCW5819551.1 NYN domain-containing protein [Trueperaceae bacterium]
MRTFVYVDGFNLYYRALKGTHHKWLDLLKLSEAVLPSSAVVERINYYTARVSGKRDPDMPRRQQFYFGAHLVRDAFLGAFEQAAIITNDSDLAEPVRIVVKEVGLPVILLTPENRPVGSLARLVSDVRHIKPSLSRCQFPDPVGSTKGPIAKPSDW